MTTSARFINPRTVRVESAAVSGSRAPSTLTVRAGRSGCDVLSGRDVIGSFERMEAAVGWAMRKLSRA